MDTSSSYYLDGQVPDNSGLPPNLDIVNTAPNHRPPARTSTNNESGSSSATASSLSTASEGSDTATGGDSGASYNGSIVFSFLAPLFLLVGESGASDKDQKGAQESAPVAATSTKTEKELEAERLLNHAEKLPAPTKEDEVRAWVAAVKAVKAARGANRELAAIADKKLAELKDSKPDVYKKVQALLNQSSSSVTTANLPSQREKSPSNPPAKQPDENPTPKSPTLDPKPPSSKQQPPAGEHTQLPRTEPSANPGQSQITNQDGRQLQGKVGIPLEIPLEEKGIPPEKRKGVLSNSQPTQPLAESSSPTPQSALPVAGPLVTWRAAVMRPGPTEGRSVAQVGDSPYGLIARYDPHQTTYAIDNGGKGYAIQQGGQWYWIPENSATATKVYVNGQWQAVAAGQQVPARDAALAEAVAAMAIPSQAAALDPRSLSSISSNMPWTSSYVWTISYVLYSNLSEHAGKAEVYTVHQYQNAEEGRQVEVAVYDQNGTSYAIRDGNQGMAITIRQGDKDNNLWVWVVGSKTGNKVIPEEIVVRKEEIIPKVYRTINLNPTHVFVLGNDGRGTWQAIERKFTSRCWRRG